MKVGIMSMQRIINYGSFLQAYGLKKTIESMGHEVQFVDYKIEPSVVSQNQGTVADNVFKTKLKKVVHMLYPEYRAWRKRQIKLNQTFSEFVTVFQKEYLPALGITDEINLAPEVDTLVIGSDEVFNCTQSGDKVGYSRQLFGEGNQAKRLISYAASFGNTTFEKLKTYSIDCEIGTYLSAFDAISVRDSNSYNIVKSLTGTEAYRNIDPVLLYPFTEVEDIEILLKDYIVVYAYADRISSEEAAEIRKFAQKKGKKVVALGFYQPFCDEWISATPLEVLAYVKYADYVITDTFHGTIFSIKYQKRFGTIIRESNKEKLGDLLRSFNLETHQIIDLRELPEIVESDVDERTISKLLKEKREAAIAYLKREL